MKAAVKWIQEWGRDLSHRALTICLAVSIFAALVIALHVPLLYPLLETQDRALFDQYFQWRADLWGDKAYKGQSPKDILIISIDQNTAETFGQFPLPRQTYAALLKKLRKAKAHVVGFDVVFDGPSPLLMQSWAGREPDVSPELKEIVQKELDEGWKGSATEDDNALAVQLYETPRVVLGSIVDFAYNTATRSTVANYHLPPPFIVSSLGEASTVGNIQIEHDEDMRVRKMSTVFDEFDKLAPFFKSFALRTVERIKGFLSLINNNNELQLGPDIYPKRFAINYIGPRGSFKAMSMADVLKWQPVSPVSETPFTGKIVLIGYQDYRSDEETGNMTLPRSQTRVESGYLTPVSDVNAPLSGVELQANVIANLLDKEYITLLNRWQEILLSMFVGVVFAVALSRLSGKPWGMLASVAVFGLVLLSISFLSFLYLNLMIPVMVPTIGVALPACLLVLTDQNLFIFNERRRHTRIVKELAPDRLAREIDRRQVDELGLSGKHATISALIIRIQGFMELTKDLPADQVIQLFNEAIEEMIEAVYDHNGIVDRAWNYGVMALWGAPIDVKDEAQARLASSCALDTEHRLQNLFKEWKDRHGETFNDVSLSCMFSIATGDAICGRIGWDKYTSYGAIGKSIDLALAMESLNRRYGTKCIIGKATADLVTRKFEVRELDKVRIEPGGESFYIYELLCNKGECPGAKEEAIVLYRQGRAAMEERNFEEAVRLFESGLGLCPEDMPCQVMLQRAKEFLVNPPASNWDGAALVTYE